MRSLFSETKDEFYQTLNEYSMKRLRKFSSNKYICNSGINPISILSKRVNRRYVLQLISKTKYYFYQTLNKYSVNGLRKFSINKYLVIIYKSYPQFIEMSWNIYFTIMVTYSQKTKNLR